MQFLDQPKLRNALVELIESQRPTHHVTVMLPLGYDQKRLEDNLSEWVIRVNRFYLGRSWFKPQNCERRMRGLAFFENGKQGDCPHAHLLIRPPVSAFLPTFPQQASSIFCPSHEVKNLSDLPRSIAPRGIMLIQTIDDHPASIRRLALYDTKEMEFRLETTWESWRFIDDLARKTT
jgi:hypothetical protein